MSIEDIHFRHSWDHITKSNDACSRSIYSDQLNAVGVPSHAHVQRAIKAGAVLVRGISIPARKGDCVRCCTFLWANGASLSQNMRKPKGGMEQILKSSKQELEEDETPKGVFNTPSCPFEQRSCAYVFSPLQTRVTFLVAH